MSDSNFQKVTEISNLDIDFDLGERPSSKEMCLGLSLFSFSIALYSVYCMLIKVMLTSYNLTVPELTFYISLFLIVMFYLFAR